MAAALSTPAGRAPTPSVFGLSLPLPGLSPQMDTIDQINGLSRFEEVPHEVGASSQEAGVGTLCAFDG